MAASITDQMTQAHSDHDFDTTLLELLPAQGEWNEEGYLWLTSSTNRLIELVDGRIEVLPMPTERHQAVLLFLYRVLFVLLKQIGGKVYVAPLRLRLPNGTFREPDLLLLLASDDPRRSNAYWTGADLVIEIVSPDDPKRDTVQKRIDYAQSGIPEYWIVNPQEETVTVLQLEGNVYTEHGVFKRGDTAISALLPEFVVSVDATLDAE